MNEIRNRDARISPETHKKLRNKQQLQKFADVIVSLEKNTKLKNNIRNKAHRFVRNNFSMEIVLKQWEYLLQDIQN